MSDLLDAALAYRKRGWSIIPISTRTKRPLIKWAEFQRRIASEQEIRRWWKERPSANIGIVTGPISNLVVLDVDTKRGADAKRLYRAYPTPFVVKTGGGGFHFYYSYPKGIEVRNSTGPDGIDVRGTGGYVVAPPSQHASGRHYSWLKGSDDEKPTLPPEYLLTRRSRINTFRGSRDWIDAVIHGVTRGHRNEACSQLAGYYLNKMPVDVVLHTMLNWNKLNDPPLPESEVRQTVESVHRTHERNKSQDAQLSTRRLADDSTGYLQITNFAEYMAKFGTASADWIVKGWLPDKSMTLIVAAPGSYKTWMMLDLAISVASGRPFLNLYPVERTGPVLIFQQEDWPGMLAQRCAVITTEKFDLPRKIEHSGDPNIFPYCVPPNLPIYFHEHRKLNFGDPEAMDALYELVLRIRPRLVMIDPLYSAASIENYMAGAAQQMLQLKTIRDELGAGFSACHHTSKRLDKVNGIKSPNPKIAQPKNGVIRIDREEGWGSQYINAWTETGWQIRREDKPGRVQILRHFKVSPDSTQEVMQFTINTKTGFTYIVDVQPVDAAEFKQGPGILALLDSYGPLDQNQLIELMNVNRSTVHRHIKGLLQAGEIKKGPEGKFYSAGDMI